MRSIAVLEVTAVTALTHLAYKALKLVEPSGQNFSPGLVMIGVSAVMLSWVHRSERGHYGVITPSWRLGVTLGAILGAVLLPVFCLETLLARTGSIPLVTPALGLAVLAAWVVFSRRGPRAEARETWSLLLVAAVLVVVAFVGCASGASPATVVSAIAWRFFFTGLGEEIFFRGFVQSRLNGAFGRPLRLLGVDLGAGLVLSALLFGLVHFLNPTLCFRGEWQVSWTWGATAFVSGLLYGCLRERTESVWAGAVFHGLAGAYAGVGSAIRSV